MDYKVSSNRRLRLVKGRHLLRLIFLIVLFVVFSEQSAYSLAATPQAKPMFDAVASYAFGEGAPVLSELTGKDSMQVSNIKVKVIPREGATPDADLPLELGGWNDE